MKKFSKIIALLLAMTVLATNTSAFASILHDDEGPATIQLIENRQTKDIREVLEINSDIKKALLERALKRIQAIERLNEQDKMVALSCLDSNKENTVNTVFSIFNLIDVFEICLADKTNKYYISMQEKAKISYDNAKKMRDTYKQCLEGLSEESKSAIMKALYTSGNFPDSHDKVLATMLEVAKENTVFNKKYAKNKKAYDKNINDAMKRTKVRDKEVEVNQQSLVEFIVYNYFYFNTNFNKK